MQIESDEFSVGNRIRLSIEGRGETIAAFSRATGIPYRRLQDFLSNTSKPSFEHLARMASGGLDIGFILTGFPTFTIDHPSSGNIEFIELGGGSAVGAGYVLNSAISRVSKNAENGLDIRDWTQAWTEAENRLEKYGDWLTPSKRNAVTFALASNIAAGVKARLYALGLLTSSFTTDGNQQHK